MALALVAGATAGVFSIVVPAVPSRRLPRGLSILLADTDLGGWEYGAGSMEARCRPVRIHPCGASARWSGANGHAHLCIPTRAGLQRALDRGNGQKLARQ